MHYVVTDLDKLHNLVSVLSALSKYITWHLIRPNALYLLARDARAKHAAATAVVQLIVPWFFEELSENSGPAEEVFSVKASSLKNALRTDWTCFLQLRTEGGRLRITKTDRLPTRHPSSDTGDDRLCETEERYLPISFDNDIVRFEPDLVPRWRDVNLFKMDALTFKEIIERTGGRYHNRFGGTRMELQWNESTWPAIKLTTEVLKSRADGDDSAFIDFSRVDVAHEEFASLPSGNFKFPSRDVTRFLDRTISTGLK
eukprot:Gregarina_sp_Poly_1__8363@NODE_48_length_17742_cov_51_152532_g42_i0_p7_GENE_NODE_48_length_17742_cov_51_152532_g42_i0NODE_48_length_17742_cov_51_152532_g42_i0_p7_ORF_typecomplete_len257_score34_52Peptidase_M13_N/PF05649_13/0_3_NODE_48_length_17742_cov_51_152532_g42_i032314001